jgi:altronate hydrolase
VHFSGPSADHAHCRPPNLGTENRNELGAMARAGTINLVDGYAEAAEAKGFVFMDTPGHDCIAATG